MRPIKGNLLQLLGLFTLLSAASPVIAQEVLFPLNGNQLLKSSSAAQNSSVIRRSSSDTLLLPFIDDFSREGVYPQADRWIDSFAFINSSFPEDPVTIGVATLDGVNQFGNPYDPASGTSSIADYLTSLPIDLSGHQNDTTIWLSFFYQPQGLGDAPESGDSLVVEFRDDTGDWTHQWSVPGRSDTAFVRVNLRVNDPAFLYNAFRFRFKNYATVNGNRDHWNIDYVIMRSNTFSNDSIRDNGFVRPRYSLLQEFESMPYTHYKALSNPGAAMSVSISDSIRDINYGPTSFIYTATIRDESGNPLFSSPPSSLSGNSNTITAFNTNLNGFAYPSTTADRASFEMKNYVTITGTQSNLYNDTVKYTQVFDDYYAYDDGSAELGYGVTGNTGVKFAYRFDIKKADTLRAVDIYFNPTGVNVTTTLFQLCVWDQVTAPGFSDNIVYRQINQRPRNIDSLNGFARYVFDTLIVLQPGPIWVGFIQNNPGLLIGMGLDRNTDNHQNMFYGVDGYWYPSSIQGSWMMRPVFGDTLTGPIGIDEVTAPLPFTVFPQPATTQVTVLLDRKLSPSTAMEYLLLSSEGQIVRRGALTGQIPLDGVAAGSYLLRISDRSGRQEGERMIIIQR
ncbi:MAG: hypothetical protein RL213_1628 [Bacteroidota bacterium]|jgi:hypothetical protein